MPVFPTDEDVNIFLSTYLANAIRYPTFEVAEQFGMPLQAAAATVPELERSLKSHITTLLKTLKDAKKFSPDEFHTQIQQIVRVVG